MKKGIFSALIVSLIVFFTGCTMTNTQMNAIAKQSGMITAISWITTDNPTEEVKAQVKDIISTIEEKSKQVKSGESYAAVLSPILDPIIKEKIPVQYIGLVKLGINALLSGIDLLFAMYPDVASKEDMVVALIHEFCLGAQDGLSLSTDSKIMKAIKPGLQSRAVLSRELAISVK